MISAGPETIILAISGRHRPDQIASRLSAEGHLILGPATRASRALALAARSPATLALIDTQLDGRRNGRQLAARLERMWGIPSLLVDGAAPESLLVRNRLAR